MVAENTMTPTLNGPGRSGEAILLFAAAPTWLTWEPSMPAAVRFVTTSKNANADPRAILKAIAGIGSLRSVCEEPKAPRSGREAQTDEETCHVMARKSAG